MNPDPKEPLEDDFTSLMAAFDDALAEGSPPSPEAANVPAEMKQRVERDLECLHLLNQLRLRHAAPAGGASAGPQESGADLQGKSLGRFQIHRQLGRGGFGVVLLAHDPQLRRGVALKVPRVDALVMPELRARFQHEARAAAGLN